MIKTTSASFANAMKERFIICKYSENEKGEVKLSKVGYSSTEEKAKEQLTRLFEEKPDSRFVILKELYFPTESW